MLSGTKAGGNCGRHSVSVAAAAAVAVTTAATRINCDSSSSTFHRRQDLAQPLPSEQGRPHYRAEGWHSRSWLVNADRGEPGQAEAT